MENKGVSILIPTYNFVVTELVQALHQQAISLDIKFEIRCYDDLSSKEFKKKNHSISTLPHVVYTELEENIGRSKIRNLLAEDAVYENLIFIDGDSKVVSETFLNDYIVRSITHDLIIGGTSYSQKPIDPSLSLRWKYGKNREEICASERNTQPYLNFTINNAFITKEIYLAFKLDETITTYGHEDTKLGLVLKQNNIPIFHINNPIEHIGLEANETFIQKTEQSVKNLYSLSLVHIGIDSKLCSYSSFIQKYSLSTFFKWSYNKLHNHIQKDLLSKNPTLFYFDLFKLNLMLVEHDRNTNSLKNH